MPKKSAGLVVFRVKGDELEVLLVHPGGPFWAKKDEGVWSIPKGEIEENEEPLGVARREFIEEIGFEIGGSFISLEPIRQAGGKTVYAWAVKGEVDPSLVKSNTFVLEWPPKSGRKQEFPEVDKAAWFSIEEARKKILKGQLGFLDQLMESLGR